MKTRPSRIKRFVASLLDRLIYSDNPDVIGQIKLPAHEVDPLSVAALEVKREKAKLYLAVNNVDLKRTVSPVVVLTDWKKKPRAPVDAEVRAILAENLQLVKKEGE